MTLNPIECLETITLCTNHAPETVRNICRNRGLEYIEFFIINSNMFVFIFKREDNYIIVVTNPRNDLEIDLGVNSKAMVGLDREFVKYRKDIVRVNTYLHEMYWFVIDKVKDSIKNILNSNNYFPTRFQFIGHGIGGGVATLICMEISRRYISVLPTLMTFGAPRVGDKSFKKLCNCNVKENSRFVIKRDPMPKTPSLVHGFRHISDELCFDKNGRKCRINNGSKKIRHPLQSYMNCITRYYDAKQFVH